MALTLQGQAGKALDSALRSPSLLKIRDLSLRLETLGDDSLTWTARTQDLNASMTILPDLEQTVSLYQDGTRIFHGHVSAPRDLPHGTRVTALGPWWWLRRTQLTSAGSAGDRPTIDLPQGTVTANLQTLLNRAIAKGAPIRIGSIAATLTIPPQKLSEMSFADAIADQLKWVADGVAWWDYSSGLPAFNLTRRAGAVDTVYALGNKAGEVTDFELAPQSELVASRVELTYMTGAGSGAVQAVQAAGVAAAGKTQVIAISGPERATTVPADFSDRVPVFLATTSPVTALTHAVRGLQAVVSAYPTAAVQTGGIVDPYTILANKAKVLSGRSEFATWNDGVGNFGTTPTTIPAGKTAVLLGLDGNQSAPDWLTKDGALARWVTADFYIVDGNNSTASPPYNFARRMAIFDALRPTLLFWSSTNPPSGTGTQNYVYLVRQSVEGSATDLPVYLAPTASVPATVHSGTTRSLTNASQIQLATTASTVDGSYVGNPIFWTVNGVRYGAFISAYVGSTRVATLHASQQPENSPLSAVAYQINGFYINSSGSYSYVEPPAGLAAALLAMQSWTPWAGQIVRKGASCDGLTTLGRKFGLTGARAALATMGAIPRAISFDFRAKTTTIELGPPARHDFGTLAQRFQQSPQSNLV